MPGPISTSGMMQQMSSSPGMMTSAQGMTSSMSQNTIPMATTSINSNNMGVGGPMANQPQDGTQVNSFISENGSFEAFKMNF